MKLYGIYIAAGYLSGSVMYGYLLPKYLCKIDVVEQSKDHNPGTANAFSLCGAPVGLLVLLLDLAKGAVPVHLAARALDPYNWMFGLVMAAPVWGHAFPAWRGRKGGKSIAVSFGVLLGLWPYYFPAAALAFFYLLFSLVIVIRPHLLRSIISFLFFMAECVKKIGNPACVLGCILLSLTVILKHGIQYDGENISVRLGLAECRVKRRREKEE